MALQFAITILLLLLNVYCKEITLKVIKSDKEQATRLQRVSDVIGDVAWNMLVGVTLT
ncbi:unnamed protein product [Dovyalis caffra]|uniref:Uncharacterized protein n=1 Tax=Dovyalis caffra TaxID=77055 RepID=A0AAV1SSI9_9ROSI|nr:unnamed protein product [Dovyalis caffra]